MNVNEYGVIFRLGASYDMSSYTSLTFVFTKPDETTLTVAGTLGTSTVTTTQGVFTANTWAYYMFVAGDVDQVGEWSVRLTYTDSTPARLISNVGYFTIYD